MTWHPGGPDSHLRRFPGACFDPVSVAAIGTAVASAAPVLAGVSSAAGLVMSLAGSQRQAAAMRGQAAQQEFNARTELIRGQQQANQLREGLLRTLAQQRSRYAGSGLAIDEGSPATVQDLTAQQAQRELTVLQGNATIRSEQASTQASLLEDAADWTATSGAVRAGVNLFDAFDRFSARQPGKVVK